MLSFTDFSNKIITDLNKRFSEVIMGGNHLVVKFGPTSCRRQVTFYNFRSITFYT